MQNYDDILRVMVRVARGCGDMMCRAHAGTIESETKSGFRDLVTRYDKEIQKYAVQQLAEAFPDAHFICEEGDAPAPEAGGMTFIIDPIDGTANFAHHYGHSCTSIGCTLNGEPVAAAIFNPFRDELFTAVKGCGALLNGERISAADGTLAESLVLFGTAPYNPELAGETIRRVTWLYGRCQDIRRTGSAALDLCYIAAGRAGLYFELELSLWDFAAGALIAEEAGATVMTADGQKLDFSRANKSSVVAGNAACIEAFCADSLQA